MKLLVRILIVAGLSLVVASCQTFKKKPKQAPLGSPSRPRSSSASNSDDESAYVSGNFKTHVVSLSNNKRTSHTVSVAKAKSLSSDLSKRLRKKGVKAKDYLGVMSAKRLSGASASEVMGVGKSLVNNEMKKSIKGRLPKLGQLEIVLAAIKKRQYHIAEHFLPDLFETKNKKIKAAAYNIMGIIALKDGRTPEAVMAWKKALKIVPSYKAARLNLGFIAAKFGDVKTAKKSLSLMQGDWYAQSGLLVAERFTGGKKVDNLCNQVLSKKPDHKATLYNCGLHAMQTGNTEKGRKLLNKVTKIKGNADIDERAFRQLQSAPKVKAKKSQKK